MVPKTPPLRCIMKLLYRFFLVSFLGFLLTDEVAALGFFTASEFFVSKLSVSYNNNNQGQHCFVHMLLKSQAVFIWNANVTFDPALHNFAGTHKCC